MKRVRPQVSASQEHPPNQMLPTIIDAAVAQVSSVLQASSAQVETQLLPVPAVIGEIPVLRIIFEQVLLHILAVIREDGTVLNIRAAGIGDNVVATIIGIAPRSVGDLREREHATRAIEFCRAIVETYGGGIQVDYGTDSSIVCTVTLCIPGTPTAERTRPIAASAQPGLV
jgi:hypothetical protein